MPKSLADKSAALKSAKANYQYSLVERIDSQWIDLRGAYASTVNKAQGSTFDRVFIDLDDIRRCNSGDQIARMLYVGVSRAKQQVFLTGDIA
jgi:ATP-dependent exoDNAse (exonuclease V) alpha subunit